MYTLVPGSLEDNTQDPIRTAGTATPTLAAELKPGFFATGLCKAALSENDLVPYVNRPWLSRLNDDLISALSLTSSMAGPMRLDLGAPDDVISTKACCAGGAPKVP